MSYPRLNQIMCKCCGSFIQLQNYIDASKIHANFTSKMKTKHNDSYHRPWQRLVKVPRAADNLNRGSIKTSRRKNEYESVNTEIKGHSTQLQCFLNQHSCGGKKPWVKYQSIRKQGPRAAHSWFVYSQRWIIFLCAASLTFGFSRPSCLSALGQIMLYVDGMNGVIGHTETIQWLYTLVGSKV